MAGTAPVASFGILSEYDAGAGPTRHTQLRGLGLQDAHSHELASAGFWPGIGLGEAAFYAYAYPSPAGFSDCRIQPEAAYFHDQLGEFILPYEAVRTAADPDQAVLSFLQSTYESAAALADWDHACLAP